MALASLPRTPLDRAIALVGMIVIGLIFAISAGVALVTIIRLRMIADVQQRQANRTPIISLRW